MEMGNASGYEDARLSDVRRYGSGEGSLLLKLDDVNGVTIPVTITAGGQTEIIDNL